MELTSLAAPRDDTRQLSGAFSAPQGARRGRKGSTLKGEKSIGENGAFLRKHFSPMVFLSVSSHLLKRRSARMQRDFPKISGGRIGCACHVAKQARSCKFHPIKTIDFHAFLRRVIDDGKVESRRKESELLEFDEGTEKSTNTKLSSRWLDAYECIGDASLWTETPYFRRS